MKLPTVAVLDFETHPIRPRPAYPPKPVSFALQLPGERKPTSHMWGHPTGNNCDKRNAARALEQLWRYVNQGQCELLCHHGKFDVDVACTEFGLPMLPALAIHDTKFLLFLNNPHSKSLSLKPASEELLGMPPEERDAVVDWLKANFKGREPGENWAAYIGYAPGQVVKPYMEGDVIRTLRLFKYLHPRIVKAGMLPAYQREQQLMPILLRNEQEGVRVDVRKLEHDYAMYGAALEYVDAWLRKRLKAPDLNVDSDAQLAQALISTGVIAESDFTLTATGKLSTSKKTLTENLYRDAKVYAALAYRGKASTFRNTFIGPWYLQARQTGSSTIHTNWNQVRSNMGSDSDGARSGRMSSSPNFQNVPKPAEKRDRHYRHPAHFDKIQLQILVDNKPQTVPFPRLPIMREYFLPDKGQVWGRRDYNQQELRELAHFENGALMRSYIANPRYDMHAMVQAGILRIASIDLNREDAKISNFQDIYGGGLPAMCNALGIDPATAQRIKTAKRALMPDYEALVNSIKERGRSGQPITTWGGRQYYCEPPAYNKKFNREMTFEYKLLNYLIQGSAADTSKQSLINYDAHPKRVGRFLLQVHDENNVSIPRNAVKQEMAVLRECMQAVEFDVPMLSDGETGPNWGTLTAHKEPDFDIKSWRKAHGYPEEM